MKFAQIALAGIAALTLAACQGEPPASEAADGQDAGAPRVADPADHGKLRLSGEAVTITGPLGTNLAFGSPRAAVEKEVSGILGLPEGRDANGECGAGPMEFTNYTGGLTLNFRDGRLVGWTLESSPEPGGIATASDIGPGSSASAVAEVLTATEVEDSTLGDEFYSDTNGIGGFFAGEGDARIVDSLYAGTTCFFR
jgi:hypothetical protein